MGNIFVYVLAAAIVIFCGYQLVLLVRDILVKKKEKEKLKKNQDNNVVILDHEVSSDNK